MTISGSGCDKNGLLFDKQVIFRDSGEPSNGFSQFFSLRLERILYRWYPMRFLDGKPAGHYFWMFWNAFLSVTFSQRKYILRYREGAADTRGNRASLPGSLKAP
jgi:hypothetical protein